MTKLILTIAALLITTGCGMMPKVPVEAHCQYQSSGNKGRYNQCMNGFRTETWSGESAPNGRAPLHERPLFDTRVNGLEMGSETRYLMNLTPSDGYQNDVHQREESIVIRDAHYRGGNNHHHKNHQHMENLGMHESELNNLKLQVSRMEKILGASREHQNQHNQLEAGFTEHREAW